MGGRGVTVHGIRAPAVTQAAVVPLVVVEEAFPARGSAVQLAPRITVQNDAPRAPFPVRLRLPDGRERAAMAALDVAHMRGPHGAFAMVRLLGMTPGEVPPGTEVWPATALPP
jgi:hypothetical protein